MITLIKLYLLILFTGDETMLIISALHNLNFFVILAISVLANLTSDIIIFILSPYLIKKIKNKKFNFYKKRVKKFLNKFKKPKKLVIASKFIYGTRIASVILISNYHLLSLWKFILYDILGLSLISIVILSLGWFFGAWILGVIDNLFIFILVIVILFYIIKKWRERKSLQ